MEPVSGRGGSSRFRTLIVAPVEQGSGETITALHVAERLSDGGGAVGFLASSFARRFIARRFPDRLWPLGPSGPENRRQWDLALREMDPDVILFADYPLMFFPSGCAPLAAEPGWVDDLGAVEATLVTMDHFGFSHADGGFFMGPPHLGFFAYYSLPPLPPGMHVMLPCPMHEPAAVPDRVGEPFRHWDVPLALSDLDREAVRRGYGVEPGGVLVFHSVPAWAIAATKQLGLPLYTYLPELLDMYFGGLDGAVTLVSVNDGGLLHGSGGPVRITNLAPIPHQDFERLLLGADLVITENALSISMGKAACALRPCAVLTNSLRLIELVERVDGRVRDVVLAMERARLGAVYRFAVYPSVTPEDLDAIGLYRGNRLMGAFRTLEIFGGDQTRDALHALLRDPVERSTLRRSQQEYVDAVSGLPDGAHLLGELIDRNRSVA